MYSSLYVKCPSFFCLQIKFNVFDILIESAHIQFHTHLSSGSRNVLCTKTDITKLKFAIRKFVLGGNLKIEFLPRREQNFYQIQEYTVNDV